MHISTPKVTDHNAIQEGILITIVPNTVSCAKAPAKRRFKKVSASCWCASERAHSLKYEAVLETVPKANSIVSIIWWTKTSPKE